MDFDLKKARRDTHNKHSRDKYKAKPSKHRNSGSKATPESGGPSQGKQEGHATPLITLDKPVSYTETDPAQFEHLKRETDDIAPRKEQTYRRRVIVSNWERYELPPDSAENLTDEDEAFDFEKVVNALADTSRHMKLRHEQTWGGERSELQGVLFNIDMKKLSSSLERIPFHVRQNLSPSLLDAEKCGGLPSEIASRLFSCLKDESCSSSEIANRMLSCLKDETPILNSPQDVSNKEFADKKNPSDKIVAPLTSTDHLANTLSLTQGELLLPETTTRISQKNERLSCPRNVLVLEESTSVQRLAAASKPKDEELDIDFLLSLDSALPKTEELPQRLPVRAAANSHQSTETKNLDTWLDDLLDD